ncbi:hypothetical protein AWB92_22745 [Mycobacterium sp. IEC1808]|uniref:hypothetical protein n=1 Tax=Mycobacterium sp. IEC1808 TaxID=1743230 RepID=UPI000A14C46E|nr:hypothetical protein [Mycobacterium sp. IEC1808]ORW88442.1 hypothetical protein AWB92_22745 [Mycobacterium sp. IEC1808]
MKAQVKKAIAVFGGTAVLAATIGFGAVTPVAAASSPTPHASPSATAAHPGATAPAGGSSVHIATLTACVSGLDC